MMADFILQLTFGSSIRGIDILDPKTAIMSFTKVKWDRNNVNHKRTP
jgi:hypothetical protein